MTDEKNSKILIYGLGLGVVLFFVYMIIKEQNKTLLSVINQQTIQPQILQSSYQADLHSEHSCQTELQLHQLQMQTQELQTQTKQISDQLQFQNQELQLLHELQLKQEQNISNIQNTKCSNVVSMDNNNLQLKNNIKNLSRTNTKRESDEHISSTIFGMS